jgi:hypothetical protein
MTCSRCGHWWTVLPAHVIRGESERVQCPACGNVEEYSQESAADPGKD